MRSVISDPATEVAIRDGHRRILDTFRDFTELLNMTAAEDLDRDGIRAAVAFLRQSVLPFARWEDQVLAPLTERAEDSAFEHAFLAVEIEALSKAVDSLLELTTGDPMLLRQAVERVQRHAFRVEAVLELHVLKGEDREINSQPDRTAVEHDGTATHRWLASRSRRRSLTVEETYAFLQQREWGMLCTIDGEQPYAVPVSYVVDRGSIYVATGPGRKLDNLENNPLTALTVAEVEDGDHWCSVVICGHVEWVEDLAERLRVLRRMQGRRIGGGPFNIQDALRAVRARVARLIPTEISGKERG